jgi:Glycosyl hydrolases family 2, TIM barrel domain/Glycosyl hydrolases family 2, sugar binding domain
MSEKPKHLRGRSWIAVAVLVTALLGVGAQPGYASGTFDAPYLDGASGPQPASTVDLAGTWAFQTVQTTACSPPALPVGPLPCVNSPASEQTTIQVPGGGWVKQGFSNVSEAIYSREIDVPKIGSPQVTKLTFGAVNHQATLTIQSADGGPVRTVGTNTTSWTPSTFDLTPFVTPGGRYRISVDVKGRYALRDSAGYFMVPEAASWSPNIAQGIFRSAQLQVFPALYISDAVVRTSVQTRTLQYDVTVTNGSDRPRTAWLSAHLRSWNHSPWRYPRLAPREVTVPAGTMQTFAMPTVAWTLGKGSYWWPNVPYRPGYRAQLHELSLRLDSANDGGPAHRWSGKEHMAPSRAMIRFGFRESRQVGAHFELNGVRVNYRGDSLQPADYDSIDNGGPGDAIDTLPGFLAPSAGNPGWPQAVENYLRLNFSDVRAHQVPWTPYMLDVADEKGLMVLDETAIRGSNLRETFAGDALANMTGHLRDLVVRDRNHASVLRWSQANEPGGIFGGQPSPIPLPFPVITPGAGPGFDEALYQTVMAVDQTRPISTDFTAFDLPHDNYTTFCHYNSDQPPLGVLAGTGVWTDDICENGPSQGKPRGQGEYIWPADNTKQGFTWFATTAEKMREKGADDIRPYTLLSAWSSLIPGTQTTQMQLEQGGHPIYGEDNLPDPWTNPQIQRVQKAFSPVLVADRDYWTANKLSDQDGDWPAVSVPLTRGVPTTRTLVVFNDTFAGTTINVRWELRTGSPNGPVAAGRELHLTVPLGQSIQQPITFTPPVTNDPLYLTLVASKPGQGVLFTDDDTRFQ